MADQRTAVDGDDVLVHYTGTLDDGSEFDSSRGREPLGFQLGAGQVIPGFEDAVRGLEPGQSRTVRIEPDEAYGPRRDELVLAVPAEQAPPGLEAGDMVSMGGQRAVVIATGNDVVVLDANHPLAGQALQFTLELVGFA
jgi:peptidylprolyl isomerase